jgi:hypothetical protein
VGGGSGGDPPQERSSLGNFEEQTYQTINFSGVTQTTPRRNNDSRKTSGANTPTKDGENTPTTQSRNIQHQQNQPEFGSAVQSIIGNNQQNFVHVIGSS